MDYERGSFDVLQGVDKTFKGIRSSQYTAGSSFSSVELTCAMSIRRGPRCFEVILFSSARNLQLIQEQVSTDFILSEQSPDKFPSPTTCRDH